MSTRGPSESCSRYVLPPTAYSETELQCASFYCLPLALQFEWRLAKVCSILNATARCRELSQEDSDFHNEHSRAVSLPSH